MKNSIGLLLVGFLSISSIGHATRLKDLATIRGVRSNQLVGYGLVVGLNGTGDSKLEGTNKSMIRMLDKLGMKIEGDGTSKNVAAVLVTADLPAFARAGNKIDIKVHSIGDAASLVGGTLVMTPLRAANQEIYAVAQGQILTASLTEASAVGRVPNGASIEKDLAEEFSGRKMFRIALKQPDFTTAARAAKALNERLGGLYASAKDGATIDLITPYSFEGKGVELLATIEAVDVNPDEYAKVVINQKTGTVIIGDRVRVSKVAISHGSLSIKVSDEPPVLSAPLNGARGLASAQPPSTAPSGPAKLKDQRVNIVDKSASVGDLVRSLNQLGVTPKDLVSILESIKAAGALHGDLEIL